MNRKIGDDTPGPLNDLAEAIAQRFRDLGLETYQANLDPSDRAILAHPPGEHYDEDHTGVGPNWIGVELSDSEDVQVYCDIYIGGDAPVYQRDCSFQDFDPEAVIPDLVQRFQEWLANPESIPEDPDVESA